VIRRWGVPAVVVLFVWTLTTHGKFSVSGDEPHYLMVAESLVADHDLDVENNYANHDGRWFGPEGLEPGLHVKRNRTGALWSVHDIGLPVALLPVYAAATRLAALAPEDTLARFRQSRGLFAYSLVSFTLIAMSAFGAALLFAGLGRVTTPARAATVTLVLVLSPPVLAQSFLVFPEVVAIFTACCAVWLWCLPDAEVAMTRVALVTLALGLLPWMQHKYSFFVLGLAFLLVQRHYAWLTQQTRPALAALGLLFAVPQLALHAWTLYEWGSLAGPQLDGSHLFSLGGLQQGGLGLLFDRERGLFGYAPIFLVAPACWIVTWRRSWTWLVPALLLFVPMAAFSEWRAGFSPAARHIVAIVPLAAVPMALALTRPLVARVAAVVLVLQAAITGYVWYHPRALWPKGLGTNQALERIPFAGAIYERWLPVLGTPGAETRAWICVAAIAAATAVVVGVGRRRRSDALR
jgi:hypothetical protein